MYVNLGPTDYVEISIGGVARRYYGEAVKVQRDETSTRNNDAKYRFLTIVVPLHDEFPETTAHINPH